MAVGDPAAAHATRLTLQERLQSEQSSLPAGRAVVYDIYMQARAIEATESVSFTSAYSQAFRETLNRLDDLDAYELEDWFIAPIEPLRETLQRALDQRRGTSSITLEEALELMRAWFAFDAYRSFDGLVRPLLAEDEREALRHRRGRDPRRERRDDRGGVGPPARRDRRRRAADAARVHARSIEPGCARGRGPRLRQRARACAHRGRPDSFARARRSSPTATTRAPSSTGSQRSRGATAASACRASGYGGFVAWSAAKRLPPALKAIATSDPMAPGIDVPSRNGIFLNSAYRWVYDILAPPDDEMANDDARWREHRRGLVPSGPPLSRVSDAAGPGQRDFSQLVESPELRPVLAEVAAVRRRVRERRHTGAHRHRATTRPAKPLRCTTSRSTIEHDANADHALLIGPFDSRSVEHGASSSVRELGSGRGGAHRPERRALRMVRACARRGGAAGAS